jgi:RNA polymerase primary sigma factor
MTRTNKPAAPTPDRAKGKRDPGRDEMLSEYLASLGGIPLLTPEQEQQLAHELRDAEVRSWEIVTKAHEAVEWLASNAIVRDKRFSASEELARLVASKKADERKGPADRLRLSEVLREVDDDRCLIDEVIAVLSQAVITPQPGEDKVARRKRTLKRDRELRALVADARVERAKALRLRNRFVRANLRLVVSVARRFHHYRVPLIDLIQEGNIGLIKSVHRFDHRKGFRFSTYGHWWIRQAIERAIMNKGTQVRLPVHVFDQRREVQKAANHLTQKRGREPTSEELAECLAISLERLSEIQAAVPREPISLDDPVGDDEDRTLGETIGDLEDPLPDERVISETEARLVRRMLERLSPMEVDIIRRRFGLGTGGDETLEAIGKSYNLSRERVRQIQVQGLKKMQGFCEQRFEGMSALA